MPPEINMGVKDRFWSYLISEGFILSILANEGSNSHARKGKIFPSFVPFVDSLAYIGLALFDFLA